MRQKTIFESFFKPNLVTILLVSLLSSAAFYVAFNSSFDSLYSKRLRVAQDVFTEGLATDMLSGADYEVYRKCKRFFEKEGVRSVFVRATSGRILCEMGLDTDDHLIELTSHVYFDADESTQAGIVQVGFDRSELSLVSTLALVFILAIGSITSLIVTFLLRKIARRVSAPISELAAQVDVNDLRCLMSHQGKGNVREVEILRAGLKDFARRITDAQQELVRKAELEAQATLARRVAHDIRSPLSALEVIVARSESLPDVERAMVEKVSRRISSIANDLLNRQHLSGDQALIHNQPMLFREGSPRASVVSIRGWVEDIVEEKSSLLAGNIKLFVQEVDNHDSFCHASEHEFKRVLSNIINNAFESSKGDVGVNVTVEMTESHVIVAVRDRGVGMSRDEIKKALSGSYTTKPQGHGMGLSSAKVLVESWGGRLTLRSLPLQGTSVYVELPVIDDDVGLGAIVASR